MHTATDPATTLPRWPNAAPAGAVLARCGRLEARLATTPAQREAAYGLRYRVFVEEGGARPADPMSGRETDHFDRGAAHIIVCDPDDPDEILATCRASYARPGAASATAQLFDIEPFLHAWRGKTILEIGRACIAPHARDGRALEMLWRGLWAFAQAGEVDAFFGAASLPGADPSRHAQVIASLAGARPTPSSWALVPHRSGSVPTHRAAVPGEALIRTLPPLLRFYWRLGGRFAPQPAVDPLFNTTDVAVVIRVADLPLRYRRRYGATTGPA